MNTKKNTVSTSSQITETVANPNIYTLKAAIFKTLALKLATELNKGTVLSKTRRSFFKILYNTFLLSSKKIPFEQYYSLHLPGPKIVI